MLRPYNAETDKEATHRIWKEVGWIEDGKEEAMDRYVAAGRALVAELNGAAECLVLTTPGAIRYLDEDLPLSAVTGVTTSYVARKKGFAGRLLARALAEDAAEGALVAGLGAFEQGYYNRLGFGTGPYIHEIAFDPAHLKFDIRPRTPVRLTVDDVEAVHACRLARFRAHGAMNVFTPEVTRAEMVEHDKAFGLGYRDPASGAVTHHMWMQVNEDRESGPYKVTWIAWRTSEELLELLALLRDLGDQIHLVEMAEPAGIQLQDLLREPFKHRRVTEASDFEARMHSIAYQQARILNLEGCLARTHLRGDSVRFNLKLSDPVGEFLASEPVCLPISGDYVVTLGPESCASLGSNSDVPTLTASVGAFTRMWLGVRPATGLAVTDDLAGPADLLARLDWLLRLPPPLPDWDF